MVNMPKQTRKSAYMCAKIIIFKLFGYEKLYMPKQKQNIHVFSASNSLTVYNSLLHLYGWDSHYSTWGNILIYLLTFSSIVPTRTYGKNCLFRPVAPTPISWTC